MSRHMPYTEYEQSFFENPLYQCWYERTMIHWKDHRIQWEHREQLIVQEKSSGRYFWPYQGQLIPVTSLEEVMGIYFFECKRDV